MTTSPPPGDNPEVTSHPEPTNKTETTGNTGTANAAGTSDNATATDNTAATTHADTPPRGTFRWWPVAGHRHALPGGLRLGDPGETFCGLAIAMPWTAPYEHWFWPTCQTCNKAVKGREHNPYPPEPSQLHNDAEILASLRRVTEQAAEFATSVLATGALHLGHQALLGAKLVSTGRVLLDAADAGYAITPETHGT